ncbi:hypothetical protein TKK_0016129 [Trichogramma kaykai]
MLKVVNQHHNEESSQFVRKFWKDFNILDSIRFVEECWSEVQSSTLNASWKKLWPEIVRESHEPIQQIIQGLFARAHSIGGEGFFDVQESEIVQLISPETEELTPQEIEGSMEAAEQKDDVDESKEPESLSVQSVCKIISLVQEAAGLALVQDPIMDRSLQFHRGCEELLKAYEEVRKDFVRRMKQSRLENYFNTFNKS